MQEVLQRFDIQFSERNAKKLSGQVVLGHARIIDFDIQKHHFSMTSPSLIKIPKKQWNEISRWLTVISKFHFGNHFIWA